MTGATFVAVFLLATIACHSQASHEPEPAPSHLPPPPAPTPRYPPPCPPPKSSHSTTHAPPPSHKATPPVHSPPKVAPAPPPKAVAPAPTKVKPAPPPKTTPPTPPPPANAKPKPSPPPPPPKTSPSPSPPKPKPTTPPPPPQEKSYHVAVEGVVYCRTCKLPGYNKDIRASPIPGAVVKLQCNSTYFPKAPYAVNATTDKNGYYLIYASPKITSKDSCKVYLVSSPLAICKKPSNYNGGITGSKLRYKSKISNGQSVYNLYTTGMLIFAPTYSNLCPSVKP